MPIRLTWTAPIDPGSGVIAYNLYKIVSPGPLTTGNLYQTFAGNVFTYDDYAYNRRLLESDGYLYKITATSEDGDSDFNLSNTVLIQYSFEDFVDIELWDFSFTGTDVLEFFEEWNLAFPVIPILEYLEEWELIELSNSETWLETWEYAFPPNTLAWSDSWEYSLGFSDIQEWIETWEYSLGFSETEEWLETWEYSLTFSGDLEWTETWES